MLKLTMSRFIGDLNKTTGPYAASMTTKATIEFVEATNLEETLSRLPTSTSTSTAAASSQFPRYLRAKTGFAEPYAHAIFPHDVFPESQFRSIYLPALPALCDIIDFTNDILSFYKETIRGDERHNFICNVAVTTLRDGDGDEGRTLRKVVDVVVDRVMEVRRVLGAYPELMRCADDFLDNYVAWHMNTTQRYRLDEVAIEIPVNIV
ncbi:isoprenoid synthase domain-containing protein [Xylariomycetidae sp. FL2044]|nr:isoprenoid synthase domain-containing protein [Xylariomycetidae sp. FL2044]